MKSLLKFKDPAWGQQAAQAIKDVLESCKDELLECEKAARFPAKTFRELGRRGLIGMVTPREYGGLGGGVPEYCFVVENLARHGFISPQVQTQGQRWLNDWGTEEQKRKYLPGMADGSIIFSESISEPGAASSLKSLKTTATPNAHGWLINGEKVHINFGAESNVTLVYAMAPEGLTSFLVDTDLPGCSSRHSHPIGGRMMPTADMFFKNVQVPRSAVLGQPGEGLKTFLTTFNVSRLGNASELLGFARRALSEGITYARSRMVGNSGVVTDFQGIQWIVADCYSALTAASLVRDQAANLVEEGQEHSMETSMAKKLAIEAADKAVNEVFSLVGGYGLYHEQPFAQLLLEVKTLRVAGGSLEILRNYVAHRVLKDPALEGLY